MNFAEIYHFLFETYAGIGCLVGAGLILSVIVSLIWEWRTRRRFSNHEKTEDDWSFFDENEADANDKKAKSTGKSNS